VCSKQLVLVTALVSTRASFFKKIVLLQADIKRLSNEIDEIKINAFTKTLIALLMSPSKLKRLTNYCRI